VKSGFSHTTGLGSSAAVTVCMVAVLRQWLNLSLDKIEIIKHARMIVQQVQGMGSGADVAASTLGGTVFYQMEPLLAEQLKANPPLCAVYSGSKMKTKEVIQLLEQKRIENPKQFETWFNEIEDCVIAGKAAVNKQDWAGFATHLKANQAIMSAMGLSNAILDDIIAKLEQDPGILAAKISGSGLGDCVIGLGKLQTAHFSNEVPIEIIEQGLTYGYR
jgi:mevalonate kinase